MKSSRDIGDWSLGLRSGELSSLASAGSPPWEAGGVSRLRARAKNLETPPQNGARDLSGANKYPEKPPDRPP